MIALSSEANGGGAVAETVRFGVSMNANLLEKFDSLAKRRSAANRSEAMRDLVRDALVASTTGEELV